MTINSLSGAMTPIYSIHWEEVGTPTNFGILSKRDKTAIAFPSLGIYNAAVESDTGTFREYRQATSTT